MVILAVDNHAERLQQLTQLLQKTFPQEKVLSFVDPLMAGKYSYSHGVDVLFTELRMKRMDGLEMCQFIRRRQPEVRCYLIGSPEELKLLHPEWRREYSACFSRPVTPEQLAELGLLTSKGSSP